MKKFLLFTAAIILGSCSKPDDTVTPPTTYELPFKLAVPYNITAHSVDLGWSFYSEKDFLKYEVYSSLDSSFLYDSVSLFATITSKKQTSTSVTDLLADTTYYFRVRVVKTDDTKLTTQLESAITSDEILIAVGMPYNITYKSFEISWNKYANSRNDFDQYEVHTSIASGFTPDVSTLVKKITNKETTSWTVDDLKDNKRYFYKIRLITRKSGVTKYFDTEERTALTWVLFFNRFEDALGTVMDSLPPLYNDDDPPDPTDTTTRNSDFTFNTLNLTNFKTIKIEYTMRARAWVLPGVARWGINFYTTVSDTIPVNTTSPRSFVKYFYDYQILSAEQADIFVDYEIGSQGVSDKLEMYNVVISGERLINTKQHVPQQNTSQR
ncbi:MAG: fibronectin type III domain-containing protein [Ignavibacteria bacterium]|nr:fibronectin type III domain-containing protein [Ignavibacteria bacterium]